MIMTFQQVSGAYLTECISVAPIRIVLVHKKCPRDFTDQKRGVGRNAEETKDPCAKKINVWFFSI